MTTPHATAAFVAARAGSLWLKTGHEILGVVENMSYYECGKCGNQEAIFGKGGGDKLVEDLNTSLLAKIPLGQPNYDPNNQDSAPSIYEQESKIGSIYMDLAREIEKKNSKLNKKESWSVNLQTLFFYPPPPPLPPPPPSSLPPPPPFLPPSFFFALVSSFPSELPSLAGAYPS